MFSERRFGRLFGCRRDDFSGLAARIFSKDALFTDAFAENTSRLEIDYQNGLFHSPRLKHDHGFALRRVLKGRQDFRRAADLSELISPIDYTRPSFKSEFPVNKIKRLLSAAESRLFKGTAQVEGLSMRWQEEIRITAIAREDKSLYCKTEYIATWDAVVSIYRHERCFKGRVASSWFNGRLPAAGELDDLLQKAINRAEKASAASDMQGTRHNILFAPGEPAIVFHELLGHALEADYVRQGTSPFRDAIGKQICHESATFADAPPPWLEKEAVDDEGTPCQETILVEKGILKAFLADRATAMAMGISPGGNGRRAGWRNPPLTRMYFTKAHLAYSDPQGYGDLPEHFLYVDEIADASVDTATATIELFLPLVTKYIKGRSAEIYHGPLKISWDINEALASMRLMADDYCSAAAVSTCIKDDQKVDVAAGQCSALFYDMPVAPAHI